MSIIKNVKKSIVSYLDANGYDLIKRFKYNGKTQFNIDGNEYGIIHTNSDYSPWLGDKQFMEIYNIIKDYTLVDIFRCYELWQLVEEIEKTHPNSAIIEIGVWRGGTSAIIARKLQQIKSNATLYMADTFTGVVKASENDAFYQGGEHKDTSLELVQNLFKSNIKYSHYTILQGIFPDDTQHLVPANEVFGICHIDVDVYSSAKEIVSWIWDRLVIGGMIIFDDYGYHTTTGVTKFVNEQRALKDRLVIHNLNGHAIIVKVK